MKKAMYRKNVIMLVAIMLLIGILLNGCGSKNSGAADQPKTTEKSKVTVWYLWGGKEGKSIEDVIKRFNDSQDKYEAVGLSVPDEQKIKVAIAGGNGPDVTDSFAVNVGKYAEEGIALPLDDLINRDKWDLSDFIPAALEQCRNNGKFYALPLNILFNVMYYNKKLLADAGFSEPPKDSKELLDIAIKTTKTNSDGTIDVLGFPAYPDYPFSSLMYSFGGEYFTKDMKSAGFDKSPGALESLKVISDYIKKFGADNIKQIQAVGKWLDPTDQFIAGKQAIRFEGVYLSQYIRDFKVPLDYGIAPLPYLEGHSEMAGSNWSQSSIFYIAKNSKNVDGSWEFMKFMYSAPELAKVMGEMVNIPARKSSMADPIFDKIPDARLFIKFSENPNLKPMPNIPQYSDISNKPIKDETEAVYNLKKSPEKAIKAMQKKADDLLK